MTKFFAAVICCLLIVSCSYQTATVYRGSAREDESFNLFNIRIKRWETKKFSGLLALQRKADKLFYSMMDPSGIMLMEAEIDHEGTHRLLTAKKDFQSSGLPRYLSETLYRIFGLDPGDYPCSSSVLMSLCLEKDDNGWWKKKATAGGFTLWEVRSAGIDGKEIETIYENPWSGLEISLKRLNR